MAVTALLKEKPKPTDADIDAAITNVCRCGTYQQVRDGDPRRSERVRGGVDELHAQHESPHLPGRLVHRRPRARLPHPVRHRGFGASSRRPRSTPGSWSSRTTPWSSASPARKWARARSPASASSSPKSSNATGRRSPTSSRRPARTSPASACGATSSPPAAAASAPPTNMSARAAPPPAMMLIQAAANEWKVPASECSASNSVITHKASGRTTTFGKVASAAVEDRAAGRRQAQGSEGLEDRRQGREAPRHAAQGRRQADLRHRHQAARTC